MADDIVIRAEGLGKKYVIGHQSAERSPTLRDAITRTASSFARTTRDLMRGQPLIAGDEVEEFWALRDIDFEIRRGDVVGIIGHNGAGKSTLLKILSRITEPSEGRVEIKGRVASLLEVGTGFHPELSGRENVFLNGAILGMSRAEIRRKFDEIVAFAEIEKFLDTPVKRYSSGMYVRLAFAVAAHLEPEILIVDEVLAVGDVEFQKKCLGKMQDVAGEGRTVLFVSHNLSTISALCPRTILLEQGRVDIDTTSELAISRYVNSNRLRHTSGQRIHRSGDYSLIIEDMIHRDGCSGRTELAFDMAIAAPAPFSGAINFFLKDEAVRPVGACSLGGMGSESRVILRRGTCKLGSKFELPRLAEGAYFIDIELSDKSKNRVAFFEEAVELYIFPVAEDGCAEVLKQSWGFGSLWIGVERQ